MNEAEMKMMAEIRRKRQNGEKLTPEEMAFKFPPTFPPVDEAASTEPSVLRRKQTLKAKRKK